MDFVVTERRRPIALIECKLADERPSDALARFREALGGLPAIQLVRTRDVDRRVRGTRVLTASRFLAALV